MAETINGLYKAEVIHRRGPWRSLEAIEFATLEWVDWFNNRRLLEPTGNIPPAEAEAVVRAGRRGELQPREFQLLEYLLRNADRVVTRTMLLEAVWEFPFDPKTNIVERT